MLVNHFTDRNEDQLSSTGRKRSLDTALPYLSTVLEVLLCCRNNMTLFIAKLLSTIANPNPAERTTIPFRKPQWEKAN